MTWLFTLLAMAVIALVAGVVTGRISGGMDAPPLASPFRGLPPDVVVPGDLEVLRFTPALRGYRMEEVDQVLDRVAHELSLRDAEIARLHAVLRGDISAEPDGISAESDGITAETDGSPYGTDAAASEGPATGHRTGDVAAQGDREERPGVPDAVSDLSPDSGRGRF